MTSSEETSLRGDHGEIAEFQGLYGTYHVAELLLQKIWLRREFSQDGARTVGGDPIRILDPGKWNRLSGPDFRGARLRIGGRELHGDVEVHFRAEAWIQHGHDRDPAYDDVVLHVVLFPPSAFASPTTTRSGHEVPVLAIVDLLWYDLEEYATDDAVAALSDRDPWPALERLLSLETGARSIALREAAERRWRQKCHFASLRVRRLGWDEACHQSTLEILGYRSNRVAMLKVGGRFPWSAWTPESPRLEELLDVAADSWSVRGVRPANHPRLRLEQYRRWATAVPDWPKRLLHAELPAVEADSTDNSVHVLRRKFKLAGFRERFARDLCGDALGGDRLDTWVANLALPFLASTEQESAAFALWLAWYPGDAPRAHAQAARQLLTEGREPLSNGLLQAILGMQLDRWSADASVTPAAESDDPDA